VAWFVVAGAVACDSPEGPDPVPGGPGWRESQAVAIHEAVYRFQFEEHAAGAQPGSITFCLARTTPDDDLPWSDPPEALLRRFAGHVPVVKKASLCRLDLRGDTDPATGGPAIIFRVAPPQWQSDTEVLVDGGYHSHGLSASGETYRVRYQAGGWVVVEAIWRWIA
jgi:hypothetical protein